ncbi:unnamed protein product, partial [Meganyctiphanes norvegica]
MMASRNFLVRGMMLGHMESPHMKSPVNMSPMSNLSFKLQCAKLSKGTPKRKLSLSSNSPSPCPVMEDSSPLFGRDKENFQSPDFARSSKERRLYTSPLRDVQNIRNRNINFSPIPKMLLTPTPPKNSYKSTVGEIVEQKPIECAKKDINLSIYSPNTHIPLPPSSKSIISSTPLTSLSARTLSSLAMCNDDDIFDMDLLNEDGSTEEIQPKGFSTLLSAPIKCSTVTQKEVKVSFRSHKHLPIRRCLSKMEVSSSPTYTSSFKRPQPPTNLSQMMDCKRRKSEFNSPFKTASPTVPSTRSILLPKSRNPLSQIPENTEVKIPQITKPKLFKCNSESQVSIMKAISRSANVSEKLTGDFSRPVSMPTVSGGKHPDLTSISHDTLADLIKGNYSDKVNSFKILDCRYPYEFSGGHIKEAESWHTPQMVLDHLATQKGVPALSPGNQKRDVLIFHCEFSVNRGPKAQRLLREKDRTASLNYPALHYPEIYLLEGGYKVFYQNYPELCTPEGYTSMLEPKYSDELKHFRAKSKSWAGENKKSKTKGLTRRAGLRF